MALLLGVEICRVCTKHQGRTKSLETFGSELANFNQTQRITTTPRRVTLLA